MGLRGALQEWEQCWRNTGAPVDELLAPGIGADEVRTILGRDLVHLDVLTWFAWHNGGAEGGPWDAVPTGRWLCDLAYCVGERELLKATMDMWEQDGEDIHFRDSYLPLMTNEDFGVVFVDLDDGAVYRWDNMDWSDRYPARSLRVSDDLETIVRTWVEVLHLVQPRYSPGQSVFEFDSSLVHADLIEKNVVTK